MAIHRSGKNTTIVVSALNARANFGPPEPEVLKVLGEQAKSNGTSKTTSRQIDQIIKDTRGKKPKA
jgi:hypothetical protein